MSDVRLDVDVPEELLRLLGQSKLSARDPDTAVRVALAIHLLLTGEISVGKAAELAGQDRASFQGLLGELDLPLVSYGREEYLSDLRAIGASERDSRGERGH
jgi:predicted HTH domain antitoxin